MALKLIIGNKNYSSWSLRPWIGLKQAGIAFDEVVIPLYQDNHKQQILKYSPGGKVPALVDGDVTVWESLAILEYAADKFPAAKLWPADIKARAHARTVSAEMHSGFAPLRHHCPMNMRRPPKPRKQLPGEAHANIARINTIWTDCRARFGQGGPFLFGAFGAADAMYAPVVSRFVTYKLDAAPASRDYIAAVTALPAWKEWQAAALKEPWTIPDEDVDD